MGIRVKGQMSNIKRQKSNAKSKMSNHKSQDLNKSLKPQTSLNGEHPSKDRIDIYRIYWILSSWPLRMIVWLSADVPENLFQKIYLLIS